LALIFTPRFDSLVRQAGLAALLAVGVGVGAFYYYAMPSYMRVGYQPEQPVPFSHELHAGKLGMDCRYCHNHVVESPYSNVPATATCMNCHSLVKQNSPLLSKVRESWATGNPVPWRRVHKLPDYAYFNHSAHVNRGVSCVSCHGKVNEMAVVRHDKPLSMGFCLNCHRQPDAHLRPLEQVTNLDWKPEDEKDNPRFAGLLSQASVGRKVREEYQINPPQTCQGCHR
jgi:NAD-dependent SIR2 family protein deacetylase